MKAKKAILLVLGVLVGLVGMAFAAGGGVITWAYATQRDDGYFTVNSGRLQAATHALVSEDVALGASVGPDWVPDLSDVALRIRVEGDRPLFVGIGPTDEVAAYLDGVSYAVVTDVHSDPFWATYREERGAMHPTPPERETFWAATASGAGEQTLDWTLEEGTWSVVVMNADTAPGVGVTATAGVKAGFALPLGIGLLVGGLLVMGLGTLMVVAGAMVRPEPRRPQDDEAASARKEENAAAGK
jgi:hypothetical protein